jgi:hypothetical protein
MALCGSLASSSYKPRLTGCRSTSWNAVSTLVCPLRRGSTEPYFNSHEALDEDRAVQDLMSDSNCARCASISIASIAAR